MSKRVLLFAPAAFDLSETARMIEIAKGVVHHQDANNIFDIHFISNGGDFEYLIEQEGFPAASDFPPARPIPDDTSGFPSARPNGPTLVVDVHLSTSPAS